MANYSVAWVLLVSYVALLAFSSCGIGVSFMLTKTPKPDPPKLNITTPNSDNDDNYSYSSHQVPPELKKYGEATVKYSSYYYDPQMYLVLPCGLSMLMIIPIILGGLYSRKIFSTSIGLYSSVTLLAVNLAGLIMYQNVYPSDMSESLYSCYMMILGVQLGMLAIITPQIITAAWELRRQKVAWPVLRISRLFTLNTAFLVGRMVLGIYMIGVYIDYNFMMRGFKDPAYSKFYQQYDYWSTPKLRCPEYYVYPMLITLLYGVAVPIESLLSHLFGHLHTKMLSFSTLMSSVFYGGLIVITSPLFTRIVFPSPLYPEYMNWAIGAMFLSLVHAIASMAKPTAMNTSVPLVAMLANEFQSSSVGYTSDGLSNKATALRRKFKGSDTLVYNTALLVFSGVAIISLLCHSIYWWAGLVMLCGNVVIVSRVLPEVIMETLTQKVDSVPVLKMLIHVFIECGLLFIGVCGSFSWFDSAIGLAIFFNIILVIFQLCKVGKNPALRTAVISLSEDETERGDCRQLVPESHDEDDSAPSEELESNGIYQPVA